MTDYQINKILTQGDWIYLVDTREQPNSAFERRMAALGRVERKKLDFGDYSAKVIFENRVFSLDGVAAVERKMSLDEVANNLGNQRARFEREFERAKKAGGHIHLLIEGGSLARINSHLYRSQLSPAAFTASLVSFAVRFSTPVWFCLSEDTPEMIKKIMRIEMKEVLRSGRLD